MTPDPDHDRAYPVLLDRLRAWARGHYPTEAAVDLVVAHESWLRRSDFRSRCVRAGYGDLADELLVAWIDFDEAAAIAGGGPRGLPASDSELQVLAVAVGIAGWTVHRSLADLIVGLDTHNTQLVLDAIAHAAGWHERGLTATITGHLHRGAGDDPLSHRNR